jgi:hypothetical protein
MIMVISVVINTLTAAAREQNHDRHHRPPDRSGDHHAFILLSSFSAFSSQLEAILDSLIVSLSEMSMNCAQFSDVDVFNGFVPPHPGDLERTLGGEIPSSIPMLHLKDPSPTNAVGSTIPMAQLEPPLPPRSSPICRRSPYRPRFPVLEPTGIVTVLTEQDHDTVISTLPRTVPHLQFRAIA